MIPMRLLAMRISRKMLKVMHAWTHRGKKVCIHRVLLLHLSILCLYLMCQTSLGSPRRDLLGQATWGIFWSPHAARKPMHQSTVFSKKERNLLKQGCLCPAVLGFSPFSHYFMPWCMGLGSQIVIQTIQISHFDQKAWTSMQHASSVKYWPIRKQESWDKNIKVDVESVQPPRKRSLFLWCSGRLPPWTPPFGLAVACRVGLLPVGLCWMPLVTNITFNQSTLKIIDWMMLWNKVVWKQQSSELAHCGHSCLHSFIRA